MDKICPNCGTTLIEETETIDNFDPVKGHWQHEAPVLYCGNCDSVFDPEAFKDPEEDFESIYQDS
jgi:hypothetical protein